MDRDTATTQSRLEGALNRTVAAMESSILLTSAQRTAHSGPNKSSGDQVRSMFLPWAQAAVVPYFSADANKSSTDNLPDHFAVNLPPQLQFFLSEEQQGRLVICSLTYFFVNLVNFAKTLNVPEIIEDGNSCATSHEP